MIFSTSVVSSADLRSYNIVKVCAVRRHSGDVILLSYTLYLLASSFVIGWIGLPNIYVSRAARQGEMHIALQSVCSTVDCIYNIILISLYRQEYRLNFYSIFDQYTSRSLKCIVFTWCVPNYVRIRIWVYVNPKKTLFWNSCVIMCVRWIILF